jgi:hypothetical protein
LVVRALIVRGFRVGARFALRGRFVAFGRRLFRRQFAFIGFASPVVLSVLDLRIVLRLRVPALILSILGFGALILLLRFFLAFDPVRRVLGFSSSIGVIGIGVRFRRTSCKEI